MEMDVLLNMLKKPWGAVNGAGTESGYDWISGIGHRASGIGHRASGIGHRASGIGHRRRRATCTAGSCLPQVYRTGCLGKALLSPSRIVRLSVPGWQGH
jgi:hypothetical protein